MKQDNAQNEQHIDLAKRVAGLHPAKIVMLGYLSYMIVGWLLLCLPFAQREKVSAMDSLFIATSAVSTTGLVTVSIADSYNLFGQIVILLLIQLGGLGYMTVGSFVVLSKKTELTSLRADIGQVVFSLPATFRIDKFIRSVMLFTLIIEMIGATFLYFLFARHGVEQPLWSAVFHSISAFCTAGFSLYNSSFEAFSADFWLNATIAMLSYLGAIGFIVCVDVWRMLKGKIKAITLTSKIILWTTFCLTVGGTLLLFLTEPSIQQLSPEKRLLAAVFQGMTSITTVGFNTIPIGGLSKASLLVIIVLMIIGASPSGTGGGLKSTTFTAILGVMKSAVNGRKEVLFWGSRIPRERILTAVASLGLYLSALMVGLFLLELTETFSFEAILFEAASALGTVGLSVGITGDLSSLGKIIIIVLMYCGRLGPLTFSVALFLKSPDKPEDDGDLAV